METHANPDNNHTTPNDSSNGSADDQYKLINHESKGKYTNNHLLHVVTGVATEDQLRDSIKSILITAKNRGLPYITNFKVNIVADNKGRLYGYAYVWFTNPEIFNMLVGRNPDGSERFELLDDPDWKPVLDSSNWADICDEEDPPKIRKPLPPLLELPPYDLTAEQRKGLKVQGATVSSKGKFECKPTFVSDPSPEYEPNVLCGTKIPPEVTEQDLKNLFRPFVSDPTIKYEHTSKGVTTTDTYPLVSITSKRIAFITFNPATKDACFASKMVRKIDLIKDNKSYTLIFNRAFKTQRKT